MNYVLFPEVWYHSLKSHAKNTLRIHTPSKKTPSANLSSITVFPLPGWRRNIFSFCQMDFKIYFYLRQNYISSCFNSRYNEKKPSECHFSIITYNYIVTGGIDSYNNCFNIFIVMNNSPWGVIKSRFQDFPETIYCTVSRKL